MEPLPPAVYAALFTSGGLLTVGVVIAVILVVRRSPVRLLCVGVGALTFTVSQLITRLPVVSVVQLAAPDWIAANAWLWLGILALTAGLFEEPARALGFHLLLRREPDRPATPIGLGIGHGGLEAMVVVGVSQLATGATMLVLQLRAAAPPEEVAAQRDALVALGTAGSLAGLYERIPAIALHIVLSVLVFRAVRDRRWLLLGLSILLHASVNMITVASTRWFGTSTAGGVWLTELVLTGVVAVLVLCTWLRRPQSYLWRARADRQAPA